jgi:signal transduction histidine kinase/ligand-binding sensor domain-containing protein
MRKILLQIFFIIISVSSILAQEYNFSFENISTDAGLSSAAVNCIIQDRTGFIWLGTEDGLNRYDGYGFKVYRNIPGDTLSLSNNYIWTICEDKAGQLWIATESGGLNRFDPVTEKFYRYKNNPDDPASLNSNILQTVFCDDEDNIWAGTWGNGINLLDRRTNTFIRFSNNPSDSTTLNDNKIFSFFQDSKGNIWAATDGGGLNLFNKKDSTFSNFSITNKKLFSAGRNVSKVYEDPDGSLWIGTFGNGLMHYNPVTGSLKHYTAGRNKNELSGNFIWDIGSDLHGLMWIVTQSNGITLYDRVTETFHSLKSGHSGGSSFSVNQVKTVFSDRSGVLWIGTSVSGLYKVDRKKEKFLTLAHKPGNINSLPENYVLALFEDSEENIWIGTYNNLCRYNPAAGTFKHYPMNGIGKGSVDGSIVRYIYEDSRKDIYIGTYFGKLNRYDRTSDTFTKIDLNFNSDNPSANNIRSMYEDSGNTLWFCSNGGGVISLDAGRKEYKVYRADSVSLLTSDYIFSAKEDKEGTLWIGTYGAGLHRYNKEQGTFERYSPGDSEISSSAADVVSEIFVDSKGTLWFGTSRGGLCMYDYDSGKLDCYTEEDGLRSNSIFGILEDNNNNLWLSTTKGISRFNTSDKSVKNYNYNHGVIRGEFVPSASLKTKTGWMYFGGIEGISYFHPDSIEENIHIPPVVITSFKLFNKEFGLPQSISYSDTVILNYDQNNISFEFAALDYTNPSQNRYAYKIESIDNQWNYLEDRRFVNLTGIGSGIYKIKIRGSNNDGMWNEAGKEITLIVTPPFWATWWAYICYFLLFSVSIVSLRAFELNKRKKKEKEKLEKEKAAHEEFSRRLLQYQEDERKRIASELHDSLGQNLLIIKNRAVLGARSADGEYGKKQLLDISTGASSAIEEVRRISYNLHPYHLDSLGLTKSIKAVIQNLEATTAIRLLSDIDDIDGLFNQEKEINFFRIIQECINNIIKHSEAEEALIRIKRNKEKVSVIIKDNGKGFDMGRNGGIIDPAGGFGLRNLRKRIDILKGELSIKSAKDEGTTITFNIRIHNGKD